MALPIIVINSAGSNTQASGAPSSFTAIFGTAAATAASTLVTLLVDNPDLSGVATDGSAVIWVGSSSGRQFAKITGKDNTAGVKTITVANAFANTESGKNWGIGGKRATIAGSLRAFLDWIAGWWVDIQTDEASAITADIVVNTSTTVGLPNVIYSSTFTTWGTQPLIQTATVGVCGIDADGNNLIIKGLNLKCTVAAASVTEANSGICAKNQHSNNIQISDCILDGWKYGVNNNNQTEFGMTSIAITNCEIKNCAASAIDARYNVSPTTVSGCYIHDNGTSTFGSGASVAIRFSSIGGSVNNSVIVNNYECGVSVAGAVDINQCTIAGNGTGVDATGGGVFMQSSSPGDTLSIVNSILYNNNGSTNSNAGIVGNVGMSACNITNCAFGGANQTYQVSNGSAAEAISSFPAQGTVTLSASPFVSSSDWALNATVGGGAACKAAGFKVPNASSSATPPDIGAIQAGTIAGGLLVYSNTDGGPC